MILSRILLYLSAAGASVALWRRGWHQGGLREVRALTLDDEGRRQFDALLASHPRTPVSVVVDTAEEQLRDEVLPRAHGRDRREMSQRRLRQLLIQSPYRTVLRQGPAGSHLDHYLFMALTGHELPRPWLELIQQRQAPLAGIWLAPALSQVLVRRLDLRDARLLLVSEQTGGLRLSYFEAGRLRFSRLAPVDNALYANPLEGYGDEIERTRQYLLSQRLLAREDQLKVYLIDPLDSLGELHALLPESAGFGCETVTRPRLVNDLAMPPARLTESTDALYLNLLPEAERQANLQPAEMRAAYFRYLAQRALYTGGGLWLGLSLLLSGGLLFDAWRQNRAAADLARLTRDTRLDEQRLAGSVAGIQQLRVRLAQLDAWRHANRHDLDPAGDLRAALDAGARQSGPRPRQLTWRGTGASGARELRLSGEIAPFSGDYQAAHASIDALAADLRQAGWRVTASEYPMDSSPDSTAAGELSRGAERMPASFRLELGREVAQ